MSEEVKNSALEPFWKVEPVVQNFQSEVDGKSVGEIMSLTKMKARTARKVPTGYAWRTIDLAQAQDCTAVYELLLENYVASARFRFTYSAEFLAWALCPPTPRWSLGLTHTETGQLVGFISALSAHVQLEAGSDTPPVASSEEGQQPASGAPPGYIRKDAAIINFLCVSKDHRKKGLTPLLIQQITRICNENGVSTAVYTSGTVLPSPIQQCRYFHRSLRPLKTIGVNFSSRMKNMTLLETIHHYKLPEEVEIAGIQALTPELCDSAFQFFNTIVPKQYPGMCPIYTAEEFAHYFLPRPGIISTSVVVNEAGKVTDLLSFYIVKSLCVLEQKETYVVAAFSYYVLASSVPTHVLLRQALIIAKKEGCDVFNCLEQMDLTPMNTIVKNQFRPGSGVLKYYVYNWKPKRKVPKTELALVLF